MNSHIGEQRRRAVMSAKYFALLEESYSFLRTRVSEVGFYIIWYISVVFQIGRCLSNSIVSLF